MGCFCSSGRPKKSKRTPPRDDAGGGFAEARRITRRIGDSGELWPLPSKVGPGPAAKVPESSSVLGRASIASLERAVEVLDTLGSSMSSLNTGGGFGSGTTVRGNKISILAFEVANTIVKGANLLNSLSDENIKFLKEELLQSDGVKNLISLDSRELMSIAAADKREELDVFSGEVIRFGDLCKDPVWHNLGRYFQKLSAELTPQGHLKEEVETTMQQLMNLAKNTSELYHELHALDRFEQDYQRSLQEEESQPAARRESFMILHSELKRQRKLVKSLKKKSLWSRNLEEVVEKLVDIVIYLHQTILEVFGAAVVNGPAHKQRLGASGLALHYANIINKIDNIVARPLSLPPNTRDTLYHGLPAGIKSVLRARLQSFDAKEEYSVAQIKAEMEKTLRWIVPIAENTTKAHQGFGWVGEWANISTEINTKPALQHSVTRIETLYHADKEKIDAYILELVVWLHHLVIQVKNRGFGFKALKPVRSRSLTGTPSPHETKHNLSPVHNDPSNIALELSIEERGMLESVGSNKIVLGRSKSQGVLARKENQGRRSGYWSSCGSSPAKESNATINLKLEKTKVLDIMDGLEKLEIFPIVHF